MSIKDKIKGLVTSNSLRQLDVADKMGMTPQSWRNKLVRESFSLQDIIKLTGHLGLNVAIIDERGRAVVEFDLSDLANKDNK